jgi:tRNA1(Val) A37 N6-methylase TrmN6
MTARENDKEYKKFESLTFEDFKRLAKDETLSCYGKIGVPDEYRKGYEAAIFEDIKSKLKGLREKRKIVLDIGCGCSELAFMILDLCERNNSKLLLVDSEEMLSFLPNKPFVEKFPGCFPACLGLLEKYTAMSMSY